MAALTKNRLLAVLPTTELERLRRSGDLVPLTLGQVLYDAFEPIPHVDLPLTAVVSMVLQAAEGSVEIGTVGNEGTTGLPVLLGSDGLPCKALCQTPGESLRISSATFRQVVQESPCLQELMRRYAHYHLVLACQSTACNRLHSAEQRMCRWMLMMHDRVGNAPFPLTQDFLAMILGVRRPTVSIVASTLQRGGLIHYRRGQMAVLDRASLETWACGCYAVIRRELDRVYAGRPETVEDARPCPVGCKEDDSSPSGFPAIPDISGEN